MRKIYLDTEFNGFNGELISMALVSETGEEFYEVLECKNPVPWVKQHVMPILNKEPVTLKQLQLELEKYLMQFGGVRIITDWPEDLVHFCKCLLNSPGFRINYPNNFEMVIDKMLPNTALHSKIPHNALEDARSLAKYTQS